MAKENKRKERPGVMLYYSDWHAVARRLDMMQRGELVTALMRFAETAELPEISDTLTAFAFDVFAEKITRDEEKYHNRCVENAYHTYQRECKKKGIEPLSFEEWLSSDNNRYRAITTDIETIQPETELETETETELGKGAGKGKGEGSRGAEKGESAHSHEMPRPLSESEEAARRAMFIDQLKKMT